MQNPFKKAESTEKPLKLMIWGASGVGKTTLALQFPKPVMIDLEGGADLYGGNGFSFDVMKTSDIDEVQKAVAWLATEPHPYKTLIIDPITVYWDELQKYWNDVFLKRLGGRRGHKGEFYELGPKEWMVIKQDWKQFVNRLITLPINVVVIAREKPRYDKSFHVIGEVFDGEKSLPYLFDAIIRLYREGPKFMACPLKDRTNSLPHENFESSYQALEKYWGKYLGRVVTPIPVDPLPVRSPKPQAEEELPPMKSVATSDQLTEIGRLLTPLQRENHLSGDELILLVAQIVGRFPEQTKGPEGEIHPKSISGSLTYVEAADLISWLKQAGRSMVDKARQDFFPRWACLVKGHPIMPDIQEEGWEYGLIGARETGDKTWFDMITGGLIPGTKRKLSSLLHIWESRARKAKDDATIAVISTVRMRREEFKAQEAREKKSGKERIREYTAEDFNRECKLEMVARQKEAENQF